MATPFNEEQTYTTTDCHLHIPYGLSVILHTGPGSRNVGLDGQRTALGISSIFTTISPFRYTKSSFFSHNTCRCRRFTDETLLHLLTLDFSCFEHFLTLKLLLLRR
ncbi:hypothetical protein DMENIID0001_032240 [Sergentomyia squamirostris]